MSDLVRCIDTLSRASVLCVGEVMLDRLMPEATMLGDAGNVAANVMARGAA